MAEQQSMYGYSSDDVKINPFRFGLNSRVFLSKFEWIPNGGHEGKEQEAMDIKFNINNVEKSYRQFPITRALAKDGKEITDPNSTEMQDLFKDFGARITHILNCFYEDKEVVKVALSKNWKSFKEYCQAATALLPKNFAGVPLDIFLQYQWKKDEEQNRTFLEIPKKMKYARWLCRHQEGNWKEQRVANPTDDISKALWYIKVEEDNETPILTPEGLQIEHPFIKNGWFMNSNFAKQQKDDSSTGSNGAASQAMNANATEVAAATPPPPVTQTW